MTHDDSFSAWIVEEADGAFQETRIARPRPGVGEVLVRIHASGVNPLDTKIRAGAAAHARHPFPAILGLDLAGVVEAVGRDVSRFNVGDQVYGMAGGVGGVPGSMAQFAAVDADLLALKPRTLSMREAAALPLVVITAWEGLVDRARTKADHRVLIHGGAGGVGHVAVQIARAVGAEVFATAAPAQFSIVESYDATPIDYTSTSVEEYVDRYTGGEGFDVIYDTVGGPVLDASFAAVRAYEGHVVSCLGWDSHKLAPLSFRAASYSGVFTLLPLLTGRARAHHGRILELAAGMTEAGKLVPMVDPRKFDPASAAQAHAAVRDGSSRGKVVIDIPH